MVLVISNTGAVSAVSKVSVRGVSKVIIKKKKKKDRNINYEGIHTCVHSNNLLIKTMGVLQVATMLRCKLSQGSILKIQG